MKLTIVQMRAEHQTCLNVMPNRRTKQDQSRVYSCYGLQEGGRGSQCSRQSLRIKVGIIYNRAIRWIGGLRIERFWRSIEQDYIYTHIQPMMSWSSVMALMDRFFTTMSGRIRGSVAPFLQHLTVKKLRPLYSASPIKQSP